MSLKFLVAHTFILCFEKKRYERKRHPNSSFLSHHTPPRPPPSDFLRLMFNFLNTKLDHFCFTGIHMDLPRIEPKNSPTLNL
jgi:hypothetical protein